MDSVVVLKVLVQYALTGTLSITASSDFILMRIENEITNTHVYKYIDFKNDSMTIFTKNDSSESYVSDTFAIDDDNGWWNISEKIDYRFDGKELIFLNLNSEVWIKRELRKKGENANYYYHTTQIRSRSLYDGKNTPIHSTVLKYLPLYQEVPKIHNLPPFVLHEFATDRHGNKRNIWKVMELSWLSVSTSDIDTFLQKFK